MKKHLVILAAHLANVAKTDMTWVQFYPILRDKAKP